MTEQVNRAIAVMITAPNRAEAARLAEMLVQARLAACVQIMPEMETIYHWQNKIERAAEVLLIVKTTEGCFAQLEYEVRQAHSYETPEIVAVPVSHISAPYLAWLVENVKLTRQQQKAATANGEDV